MFVLGIALVVGGYSLLYYGLDVLMWSRSNAADRTRPVPLRYLLGVPVPTSPPNDAFHPPFTLNEQDAANAVTALGGTGGRGPTNQDVPKAGKDVPRT